MASLGVDLSMWRVDGREVHSPDVTRFVATVNEHSDLFDPAIPITVARAPGRLDLMGGIADYSGALVLELPLDAATFVAAQQTSDASLTVRSLAPFGPDAEREVTVELEALAAGGTPIDYGAARALLAAEPRRRWAAYVIGAFVVLMREQSIAVKGGTRVLVDSTVPLGKGVSSSAALEVATMSAVAAEYGGALGGRELARLCQMVENLVVGAPCGIMDQMTAACGERDRLLALLCQPAELQGQVALPPSLEVWGIDSGIRHEVGGADYGAVRVGAFMGYRIVADAAGLPATVEQRGRVHVRDSRWRGYLANITPAEWEGEDRYRDVVPEVIDGARFLRQYGGITDPVTSVDPARSYAVRQPTAHPIYEHWRVRRFREILEIGAARQDERIQLGDLMYQSHASYSACGLGSRGTDRLVDLVRAAGPGMGLYGAKITGGGSGGVVAVLAAAGSRKVVASVAAEYERLTGVAAEVVGGSSDGAVRFGVIQLMAGNRGGRGGR
jgi:galactokinase